jgi:Zn-finger nucleic acid-binding protein
VPGVFQLDLLLGRAIEAREKADPETLITRKPRVTGSNPAAQKVQYRKCPECDAFMHRRNFRKSSGVIIDRCNTHGTWLDSDELEQIAGFLLSGRKTPSSLAERPRAPAAASRLVAQEMIERFERSGRRREGGVVRSLVDELFALFS